MITEINIKNFKSIVDLTLPLSNINVFIGENGCGKSNILEAVAFLSLALVKDINNESLFSKGVRNAKPELIFNSFKGDLQRQTVSFEFRHDSGKSERIRSGVEGKNGGVFPKWKTLLIDDNRAALNSVLSKLSKAEIKKIVTG